MAAPDLSSKDVVFVFFKHGSGMQDVQLLPAAI